MPTIMENGKLKNLSVAEYNEYVASLRANLKLNEDGTLKGDKVEDLDKIWVNGQEFSGMSYQGFLTVNTKTYVEEPSRANDGSIPNINDYDTFVVPRCKVNFKYFSSEDYRRMCDAIQSNEFTVKYYDKQFNDFVIHKMYCEPEEMFKLYNVGTEVFGLIDYEISFIGTLNDLSTHRVTYNSNGSSVAGNPQEYNKETTYHKGDRVSLGKTELRYSLKEYSFSASSGIVLSLDGDFQYTFTLYKSYNVDSSYKFICSNPASFDELVSGQTFYRAYVDGSKLLKYKVIEAPNTAYSELLMVADVTTYDLEIEYSIDNARYFEAIYYENSFSNKELSNPTYWKKHNLYQHEETEYKLGDVVFEQLENGRKYYISTRDVPLGRPLTDSDYWMAISVKTYDSEAKYSSNKTSRDDSSMGAFATNTMGNEIYEAIYYSDSFGGKDPTNTTYWKQLALGLGIDVKWGNSLVIADPDNLFNPVNGKSSNKWNTKQDGSGFTYYPNQSMNVFKDLTLYAIWG